MEATMLNLALVLLWNAAHGGGRVESRDLETEASYCSPSKRVGMTQDWEMMWLVWAPAVDDHAGG